MSLSARARAVVYRKYSTGVTSIVLRRLPVEIEDTVACYGRPIVSLAPSSRIRIGAGTVLCSNARYTALGVGHPVVLRTLSPDAEIEIGRDVGISGASICAARRVTIGDGTLIGADVVIVDTPFHPVAHSARRHAPLPTASPSDEVVVGRNVFLGTRAIVLAGSRIGSGTVIGAGSVVTGEIPAGVVAAGNPCRVVRPL